MALKIKKGVSPPVKARVGRPREYDFDKMDLGDMVEMNASYQTAYTCIRQFKRADEFSDWEFRIQKVGKHLKKVQVWRTK
jgi:hypothetical protein